MNDTYASITVRAAGTALLLGLAAGTCAAEDAVPLPGLEECIAAAQQQRAGAGLFAWKYAEGASYRITMLSPDGKMADAICAPGVTNELKFENRIGLRKFDAYKKIAVDETSARHTATLPFRGPVRITGMELDRDWLGHLAYEYYLVLPSGHQATVQVDSITGAFAHAEIKE